VAGGVVVSPSESSLFDFGGATVEAVAGVAVATPEGSFFGGVGELSATGAAFSVVCRKDGIHETLAIIAVVTVINFNHRQWFVHCGLGILVRQSDFLTQNLDG
jgi:hypothetical protein